MSNTDKVQTLRDAEKEAAANGAKAGAKARRREASEGAEQVAAVLAAETGERGDGATWHHSYRAGTDEEGNPVRRQITIREDARRHLTAEELLAATWHAAKLAAGQVAGRHGVPPLSPDEVSDIRDELVTRLLADANPDGETGNLPARERVTRSYLVQRARGIILDDPHRAAQDAAHDGEEVSPEQLAQGAESQARSRKAAHDPMLNESANGTWPEVAAAGEIVGAPLKARRAAAYLVGGGRCEGWAATWNISTKAAKHKVIPEGRKYLDGKQGRRYAAAIRMAAILDRDDLDAYADFRAAIENGLAAHPDRTRAIIIPRERTDTDQPAPVTIRRAAPDLDADALSEQTGAAIIIRSRRRTSKPAQSERKRAAAAKRAGWTTPRR